MPRKVGKPPGELSRQDVVCPGAQGWHMMAVVVLLVPSCSGGDWGLQSVLALSSPCSVVSGLCFHLDRCWVLAGADSRLSLPPAGTSSFER